MSYYMAGDYKTYGYAGDPGFLSKLWKKIKKPLATIAGGIIGGPFGAIIGGGLGGGGGATTQPIGFGRFPVPAFPRPGVMPRPPGGRIPIPIPIPYNGGAAAAGLCLPGPPGPTRGSVMPTNGCCPSGYHLEKSGLGYCVRNRRMNVCNPRSLRRAIRREKGFQRLASRVGYVKRSSGRRATAKCK